MPYRALAFIAGLAGILVAGACQDPAGFPDTLEAGTVSFDFAGRINGTFTADGRCYWSTGYPAADSACSLALDLGDTIRIRAVRDPRTIRWIHVNLEFPQDGSCTDPAACRISYDALSLMGKSELGYVSTEATITILEETEQRIRGTFSGRAAEVGGGTGDTIRITDGVFDVPVER